MHLNGRLGVFLGSHVCVLLDTAWLPPLQWDCWEGRKRHDVPGRCGSLC